MNTHRNNKFYKFVYTFQSRSLRMLKYRKSFSFVNVCVFYIQINQLTYINMRMYYLIDNFRKIKSSLVASLVKLTKNSPFVSHSIL